jgi:predicted transglutaminase-like cysteine proteinase
MTKLKNLALAGVSLPALAIAYAVNAHDRQRRQVPTATVQAGDTIVSGRLQPI